MAYTATRTQASFSSGTAVALRNDTAVLPGNNGGPHHVGAIRRYEEESITVHGTVTGIKSSGYANGADFRRFTVSSSKGQFVLVAFSDMTSGIWEAATDIQKGDTVSFLVGPEGWGSNKPRWQGTRRICGVHSAEAMEVAAQASATEKRTREMMTAFGHAATTSTAALRGVSARQLLGASSASWKRFANHPEAYLP